MSVGGLMLLIVPLALYGKFLTAIWFIDPYHPDRVLGYYPQNLPVAFELFLLAVSGVVISIYRRSELRDTIVQWSVPPGVFLTCWIVGNLRNPDFRLVLALLVGLISIISAMAWVVREWNGGPYLGRRFWFVEAIQVGFVQIGLFVLGMLVFGIVGSLVLWSMIQLILTIASCA